MYGYVGSVGLGTAMKGHVDVRLCGIGVRTVILHMRLRETTL